MTRHGRRLPALLALLLAVAPDLASAQAKPRATPASATPPSARPGTVSPAAVLAPAEDAEPAPWRIGLALGREKDSDTKLSGPRVQLELEHHLLPLGGRGRLSFVTAAGWFHGTETTNLFGLASIDTTSDLFELVPSFRASFAATPRFRCWAEVGVGGAWMTSTVETSSSLAPGVTTTVDHRAWAGVVRLSAGAGYQVTPALELGVQLPTLHRRYGETTSQTFTFSATAAYAF